MSDLTEEEAKKEKKGEGKIEMVNEQGGGKIEMVNDPRKQKVKEEGKQSLNSQMAQKVGPTNCIIEIIKGSVHHGYKSSCRS